MTRISPLPLLLTAFSVMAAEAVPASHWSFDEGSEFRTTGYVQPVPGVRGTALKFDGFTTRVTGKTDPAIDVGKGFTVEAWIAPQEYSWNWTGLVDQEQDHHEGFSFGINHIGLVGMSLAVDGAWQTFLSEDAVPLLKWTHVAATFDPASGSIAIYINGQPAGTHTVLGKAAPSKTDIWIGMSHTKQWPALTEREISKIPSLMVFDGLIDEVKVYHHALDSEAILAASRAVLPEVPRPLHYRKMPSGPEAPGPFGAYYTRLKYCDEWDRHWRVSDHPDIVVRFDESPTKVVFWRGTGYMAAWVSENDRWVSDQGPEIYKRKCYEHMSDKQCRFSHVRIIENLPSRVLVHWRTALPNIKYESIYADPVTGWQPWGDDYYYIYPDGVCVRYQRAWGPKIKEFQQIEVLCQPGTKPEDVMKVEAITVMDMNGDTNTYSWTKRYGVRLPAEKQVDGPIQITNLKSRHRHYVIGETGAYFRRFSFGAIKGYTKFPNWNHWPVAQLPNDGRRATVPDRPSSTCPGTLFPVVHKAEGVKEYVRNLYGLTDRDPAHLAILARSWNQPPELELHSGSFSNDGYDKNQRAYQLTHTGTGKPTSLTFDMQASEQSPVANLALVIRNWGESKTRLTLDGQPVAEGQAFRTGYRRRLEGVDLVAWIKAESIEPLSVSIESK